MLRSLFSRPFVRIVVGALIPILVVAVLIASSGQPQSDAPAIAPAELAFANSGGEVIALKPAAVDAAPSSSSSAESSGQAVAISSEGSSGQAVASLSEESSRQSVLSSSSAEISEQAVSPSLASAEKVLEQMRSALTQTGQPSVPGEAPTPYQSALLEAINLREAAGLPVPLVTYELQSSLGEGQGLAAAVQSMAQGATVEPVTITAVTTIFFDNPRQAGYEQWPALMVEGELPEGMLGSVAEGDYTELYREAMEAQFPGFWSQYEFGQEPRLHTVTESFALTFPIGNAVAAVSSPTAGQVAGVEDILMGFTYTGPRLDYAIEESLSVLGLTIFSFKAGFELDWALGLRLPAEVTLAAPDLLVQGDVYDFSSTLDPSNWSNVDYANSGIAAENGNEFVLRLNFFIGVQGELLGQDICPSCNVSVSEDASASFDTPFGAGSSFPLPDVNLPIYDIDLALFSFSVGLGIDPDIGSDRINADWQAVSGSDCMGSGSITYDEPGQTVLLGPITACNLGSTDQAVVELSNFQYHFSQFLVTLKAVLDFDLFGQGVWHEEPEIVSFDLSQITSGAFVGAHVQCDPLFNCADVGPDNLLSVSSTVVDLTPPATSIVLAGTAGNNGWHVSDVEVTLSAVDGPVVGVMQCGSGISHIEYSLDGTTWTTYMGAFMLTTEGQFNLQFRSTDNEGNVEPTQNQQLKIDKTPPVITGAPTTAPNVFGWWNTDVMVHFDAFDAVSGIDTVTPDVAVTAEGAAQSVTGIAFDMAGNSASFTVTDINIDKTPPQLVINDPQAIVYPNTATFSVDWTASDAISGIATEVGDLDGSPVTKGQLVELLLLPAGLHAFTVLIVDKADNVTTATVTFEVTVDLEGMIGSVQRMCDLGLIKTPGICNSLLAKLSNALAADDRGQCHVAKNMLNAFIHELDAQNGKWVAPEAYSVSRTNALYVIANLPTSCSGDDGPPGNNGNGHGNGSGGGG